MKNRLPPLPEGAKLICEIPGFENYKGYAIDREGNVWSCKGYRERYLGHWKLRKCNIGTTGYHKVDLTILSNNKRTVKLHRLIALAFIPNHENFPHINHIDCNKLNNDIGNLEWCTPKHNITHSILNNLRDTARGERIKGSKLKDDQIEYIFDLKCAGLLNKEISSILGLKEWVIRDVIARDTYSHIFIPESKIKKVQEVVRSAKRNNRMKGILRSHRERTM